MDAAPVDIVDRYPDDAPLTAADRCDRCRAEAHVSTIVNGTMLLWCLHHYNRYARALSKVSTRTRMQLPEWYGK